MELISDAIKIVEKSGDPWSKAIAYHSQSLALTPIFALGQILCSGSEMANAYFILIH